ncbi:MAG TPA: type IV pilus biogenesis/stability protein PilW [Gammaproteobacteria bacterium]|nr:type IV pilus biogenesis/stability protein PilW [Gammaproteobacteria bacterium]
MNQHNIQLPWVFVCLLSALLLQGCVTVGPEFEDANETKAAKLNVQLGIRYMQQGRTQLALEKLLKAKQQDASVPGIYTGLAVLYERMGETELARENYKQALDLAPNDPGVQNNYGAYLCRTGEYRESVEYFLMAAGNPQYDTPEAALTNAGVCAKQIPDLALAEQFFRKALRIDNDFQLALIGMAELSFAQDNWLQARAFLQRFSAAGQMTPHALWLSYQVEKKLGATQAAREYAKRLYRDFPQSDETRLLKERY